MNMNLNVHMYALRVIGVIALASVVLFLSSCEEEDDGYFTPPVIFEDTTIIDTNYTVAEPCLTSSCALSSMKIDAGSQDLELEFYTNYDILDTAARWGRLSSAIIVVHGNNRNANEYFNWMSNSVTNMNLQDEVIIIAPYFKIRDDAGGDDAQIYWTSNGWKRGFECTNVVSEKLSSYAIIDTFIKMLNDELVFPFMENIIVTGHSAGAQFTHLYAASNDAPNDDARIDMDYIVANSQYFFYPGPERFDESSNAFVVPTGCNGYTSWPYGADGRPSYASRLTAEQLESQFVANTVTYLLGTLDIFTNGTLNTADCEARLLGENRFDRGTKMYEYMETFYLGAHMHERVTVENIGHDAPAMYNSPEAQALIRSILD